MKNNAKTPHTDLKKMGTFAGVFTPSILTILGIILFLRLGFVVGQAGLKQTLLILALANGISILTSVSLSAIATNLKVKGGGDYYLISRTLGLEFGGAIGIVLFLAQSVSIAFYCIGFGEVISRMLSDYVSLPPQLIAASAVMFLFVFAWLGADWATKFQFVVMFILFLALISFFAGSVKLWENARLAENLSPAAKSIGFWAVFAIFFPAVTGFTQGVSMSGDLKDAGRSIPQGTFLAVALSMVIYFLAAILFAGTLARDVLIHDYEAMKHVAVFDPFIDAGVIAATLSSAMASFLGGPRIMQSLAADKIFPFLLPFAAGSGSAQNPRKAVLLSGAIAFITIGIGNLNIIAPVVAMFFLISYGLINYATYYEARAASPSFRPRFRWYNSNLSLAGGLVCLAAMLAINWAAGAVAIAIIFGIYQYLMRTAGPTRWADSRRSHHLQRVRENLLAASRETEHPRDWRPNLLLFSNDSMNRKKLLKFSSWISGDSGFITAAQVLEGEWPRQLAHKAEIQKTIQSDIDEAAVQAFPLVVSAPSFSQGMRVLIQSYGIGPLHANTILFNWAKQNLQADVQQFGHHLKNIYRLRCNVVGLNTKNPDLNSLLDTPADQRRIDVWWWGDKTGQLMLLLAYLMTRSKDWEGAEIRVLAAGYDLASGQTVDDLHLFLEDVRIDAVPEVVIKPSPEAVIAFSQNSTLVFFPFYIKAGLPVTPFSSPLEDLIAKLPAAALVRAAEDIDLDAEPEEGTAGKIAAAIDALASAQEKAKAAEQNAVKASEAADEIFHRMSDLLASGGDASLFDKAKADALKAKANAIKAARKAAKALTKAEAAQRRVERLGVKPDSGEKV